jgi:RND family efflux transporter MFP subunit
MTPSSTIRRQPTLNTRASFCSPNKPLRQQVRITMTTLGQLKEHSMFPTTATVLRHNGHPVSDMQIAHDAAQGEDLSAAKPRRPEQRRQAGRRARLFLAVIGIGAAGAAAASAWPRLHTHEALAETTQRIDEGRRSVTVVSPTASKAMAEVRLPGSTSALQQTVIYARTSGYIAGLNVDIGDHVKAGQLLATIASPEVDQQLLEARARLEEGKANLALAETRLNRFKDMFKKSVATDQELDDAQATYNTQLAALRVSKAVVTRLETDQSYQKVLAPFDGVITQRSIDLGSLITAGSGTNVSSLFELQQPTTMRVFVDVPQSWAENIAPGTKATVELREFPNEQFQAKVVRTSNALDPSTRTLRTELHLPNTDGRLIPGMYAQVKLSVVNARPTLVVPTNTLVIDSAGVSVVAVSPEGKAVRTSIKLGRDFGREAEVVSGLAPDARLVVSPRDDLEDGDSVLIVEPSKAQVASR